MIENLETYVNLEGNAILRRCLNCRFWSPVEREKYKTYKNSEKLGYCKLSPLYFAYTLKKNVFPLTKTFYLCERHKFVNEEILEETGTKVNMAKSLFENNGTNEI